MKLTPEQFDTVATKVADVRGTFLVKGDFTPLAKTTMESTILKILSHNNITEEEFSKRLEQRVFLNRKQNHV